jgi:hypothetical protein
MERQAVGDVELARAYAAQAAVQREQGDLDLAKEHLEKAVALFSAHYGRAHPITISTLRGALSTTHSPPSIEVASPRSRKSGDTEPTARDLRISIDVRSEAVCVFGRRPACGAASAELLVISGCAEEGAAVMRRIRQLSGEESEAEEEEAD